MTSHLVGDVKYDGGVQRSVVEVAGGAVDECRLSVCRHPVPCRRGLGSDLPQEGGALTFVDVSEDVVGWLHPLLNGV